MQIPYTTKTGLNLTLDSSWELKLIILLEDLNIDFECHNLNLFYRDDFGKGHTYHTDFYLPNYNLLLEVHPDEFIDRIMINKKDASLALGYQFEFINWDQINYDYLLPLLFTYR